MNKFYFLQRFRISLTKPRRGRVEKGYPEKETKVLLIALSPDANELLSRLFSLSFFFPFCL